MDNSYHLFVLYFTVGRESGLALVAASDEREAFQILKNSGSRNSSKYSLIQGRDIGMSSCCTFGLLMESYVNAIEAYDAIINAMNKYVGPQGPEGPQGPQGEKGDKGDKGDPGAGGDSEIFVAKYNVTTWDEINDAINSGKTVILSDGGSNPMNYLFAGKGSDNNFNFIAPGDLSNVYETITDDDQWIGGPGARREITSNKVTSISASSTDNQYPSAKAVYDSIRGFHIPITYAEIGDKWELDGIATESVFAAYSAGKKLILDATVEGGNDFTSDVLSIMDDIGGVGLVLYFIDGGSGSVDSITIS